MGLFSPSGKGSGNFFKDDLQAGNVLFFLVLRGGE